MIHLIERAGDRLLGLMVPKLTAKADLCSCSTVGQVVWGAFCNCVGMNESRRKQVCDGCHYGASYCAYYGRCFI
ncbi:hypothetical protein ACIBG8_05240 [Nonomuraea sp. NPDC050556]|uniref:hypothetical protein n=1 Tax=Nonomuraea sp. NPDC050556 TaxID=3364369 RepID=UPI003791B570